MSKTTTLFLVVTLLLFASLTYVARPVPAIPNDSPVKTKHADPEAKSADDIESCDGVGEEGCSMRRSLNAHTDYIYPEAKSADDIESCDGVGEEECSMRRSLNAHTDYIYTQDFNP